MSTTLLRQPAAASVSASSPSSPALSNDLSHLPPPPSYSYSIGAAPQYSADSLSSELPTSYAPNPNVRLDFAFRHPSQSLASPSASAVSAALPTSYAPSMSPAAVVSVASVAPSVRIYPAYNALYTPTTSSAQAQQMSFPAAVPVTVSYASHQYQPASAQALPPPGTLSPHAASVPVYISYPTVGSSVQPVHSTYSYMPASHMYPMVVSPSAPPPAAATAIPTTSVAPPFARAASLPLSASSSPVHLPVAEMSASESVHLASFQKRVQEERWLMSEQREAADRRKKAEKEREKERIKRERNATISDSFSQAFGGLFSPLKKKGASNSSPSPSNHNHHGTNRIGESIKGLSLDSKPPSKITSTTPPTTTTTANNTAAQHKHLLTDQFVRNENDPSQKMVRHLVVPTDDLVDLALRYDTTVERIRRHNRRVVFQHLDNVMNEYIHIPVNESFQLPQPAPAVLALAAAGGGVVSEDEKRNDDYVVPGAGGLTAEELRVQSEMNRQFYAVRSFLSQVARRRTAVAGTGRAFIGEDGAAVADCTESEAEFYLQEANYNVNLALAAYMDDLEWEAQAAEEKKRRQQATAAAHAPAGAGNTSRVGAAGKGAKAAKPSSLALALAEAKQQRLAAMARDSSAAQRRDDWMARRLKKRYNIQQHGQMNAPLLSNADAAQQLSAQDAAAVLSDDSRALYEQSVSSGPAFSYYANSPSVAS